MFQRFLRWLSSFLDSLPAEREESKEPEQDPEIRIPSPGVKPTPSPVITPEPEKPSAPPVDGDTPVWPRGLDDQLLWFHNVERGKQGLPALVFDPAAIQVARDQAQYQADIRRCTHDRPRGGSFQEDVRKLKTNNAGENVAAGQRNAVEVVEAWMASTGHRRNILSRQFTAVGFGMAERGGTKYWATVFVNRAVRSQSSGSLGFIEISTPGPLAG